MSLAKYDEKTLNIRGLKTSWIEAGQPGNPVVFFCHGFPDDPRVWSHQMSHLASRYHVLAPYVRGCVSSEPADDLKRYSRESVVLDHLEILQFATGQEVPVICVGHDLGVVHAMTLARRLGPRARGLIVVNGLDIEMFARRLGDLGQVGRSWYMGFMQLPILPELMAKYAPHASAMLARLLAVGDIVPSEIDGFDRRTVAPLNQYRAFARDLAKKNAEPTSRISCPVLILWGRDDGVLMPPTQKEWDLVSVNATIRILSGGHWLHRDESTTVTPLIDVFVRDCFVNIEPSIPSNFRDPLHA